MTDLECPLCVLTWGVPPEVFGGASFCDYTVIHCVAAYARLISCKKMIRHSNQLSNYMDVFMVQYYSSGLLW